MILTADVKMNKDRLNSLKHIQVEKQQSEQGCHEKNTLHC